MWLHCEKEPAAAGERGPATPEGRTEALYTLADLNEQSLELLTEQLTGPQAPSMPFARELAPLLCRLDAAGRRRASACPYLLFDAGFADLQRWRWVGGHAIGEQEPPGPAPFFTVPGVTHLAHQIFNTAWYLVRTQMIGVPLFLGMPTTCAAFLKTCSIRRLTELAEQHGAWLRPRWTSRLAVWEELLTAAYSADSLALERARMRGVQLLAVEFRLMGQPNLARRDRRNS